MHSQNPTPESAEADDRLKLVDEPAAPVEPIGGRTWKLLIVDDEEEVHSVTHLALDGFECRGRKLELLSAHSGAEACRIAREVPDIAVILLDVVMETERAGLDVVKYIREELNNHFVRIILRTGQPGQAPEHRVITDYDINDYKHKTELTRQKLFTTVYTSISSYRDLIALDRNRRGLEEVIEASARIFELRSMAQFADGVLDQLIALLYLDQDALMVRASGVAAEPDNGSYAVVAATGRYRICNGKTIEECQDPEVLEAIARAQKQQQSIFTDYSYISYFQDEAGDAHFLYVASEAPISVPDRHLIDLFIRNVAIAQNNVRLFAKNNPQLLESRAGGDAS